MKVNDALPTVISKLWCSARPEEHDVKRILPARPFHICMGCTTKMHSLPFIYQALWSLRRHLNGKQPSTSEDIWLISSLPLLHERRLCFWNRWHLWIFRHKTDQKMHTLMCSEFRTDSSGCNTALLELVAKQLKQRVFQIIGLYLSYLCYSITNKLLKDRAFSRMLCFFNLMKSILGGNAYSFRQQVKCLNYTMIW